MNCWYIHIFGMQAFGVDTSNSMSNNSKQINKLSPKDKEICYQNTDKNVIVSLELFSISVNAQRSAICIQLAYLNELCWETQDFVISNYLLYLKTKCPVPCRLPRQRKSLSTGFSWDPYPLRYISQKISCWISDLSFIVFDK